MPAERLTMRKIREVFRLKFDCDISNRQIAKSCNIARSTVAEYLFRFQQAALSWPLPQDIDDNQLEQLLYPQLPAVPADQRPLPTSLILYQQLRHKSVTLMLLWQEHKGLHPQGYQFINRPILSSAPSVGQSNRSGHASGAPRWFEPFFKTSSTQFR